MPRPTFRSTLPLLLAIAVFSGCAKTGGEVANRVTNPGGTPQSGAAMEQSAVAASMAGAPELIEDALAESGAEMAVGAGLVTDRATALIRPVTFWRHIERVERRFEFAFADTDSTGRPTTALVTVHKNLFGTFNILWLQSSGTWNSLADVVAKDDQTVDFLVTRPGPAILDTIVRATTARPSVQYGKWMDAAAAFRKANADRKGDGIRTGFLHLFK